MSLSAKLDSWSVAIYLSRWFTSCSFVALTVTPVVKTGDNVMFIFALNVHVCPPPTLAHPPAHPPWWYQGPSASVILGKETCLVLENVY